MVVFNHDFCVYRNFEGCSKSKRIVCLFLPHDRWGLHDTSWINWGNDSLWLNFRRLHFDNGFHGTWSFPGTARKFTPDYSLLVIPNCLITGKLFLSDKDAWLMWSNLVHDSADQSEFFLELDNWNVNNYFSFPMGSHTSTDQSTAIWVFRTLQFHGVSPQCGKDNSPPKFGWDCGRWRTGVVLFPSVITIFAWMIKFN